MNQLIALSLLFLAQITFAQTYNVSIEKDIKTNQTVYQKTDHTSDRYEMISTYSVSDSYLRGQGPFSQINKDTRNTEDREVIGMDVRGHAYMKLDQAGPTGVMVVVDALLDDTIEGVAIYLPIKYSAPAKFISGDWQKFQSGEEVSLELTEQGAKIAAEAVLSRIQYAMRQMKSAFAQQLGSDAKLGDLQVQKFDVKGRSTLKASLYRIEVEGAPLSFKISFPVTL